VICAVEAHCVVKKAAPEKTGSFHQHHRSFTSLLVMPLVILPEVLTGLTRLTLAA
jgi:K+-transporting ATPase A subunit